MRKSIALAAAFLLASPGPAMANSAPVLWLGERHAPLVPTHSTRVRVDWERLEFDVPKDLRGEILVTATYGMSAERDENSEIAFAFVRAPHPFEFRDPRASVRVDGVETPYRLVTDGGLLEPRLYDWLDAHPELQRELERSALANRCNRGEERILELTLEPCLGKCGALLEWFATPKDERLRDERALLAAREVIPEAVEELQRGWARLSEERSLGFLVFRANWKKGQTREIRVRYEHQPTRDRTVHVNGLETVEYLFSPARAWASFGSLDILLNVPEGVELKAEIPFRRNGDRCQAGFDTLPDGELSFTLERKSGLWLGLRRHRDYWALALITLLALAVALAALANRVARGNRARAVAISLALAGVVSLGLVRAVVPLLPEKALGYDEDWEPVKNVDELALFGAFAGALSAFAMTMPRRSRP